LLAGAAPENATGTISPMSSLFLMNFSGTLRAMVVGSACNVSENMIQFAV
jgi:hypothetical protein